MEFHEKLQELRKSRGMTQEELAEALYVSRTAISKWESGRGYPNIDSLRELSGFFSVTIDELLSGERLISIAEKENAANMRDICSLLLGLLDILSVTLIVLPLYPGASGGYVIPVSLISYADTAGFGYAAHWIVIPALIAAGAVKLLLAKLNITRGASAVTACSMALGAFAVLLPALLREPYAVVLAFLLLTAKWTVLLAYVRKGR